MRSNPIGLRFEVLSAAMSLASVNASLRRLSGSFGRELFRRPKVIYAWRAPCCSANRGAVKTFQFPLQRLSEELKIFYETRIIDEHFPQVRFAGED